MTEEKRTRKELIDKQLKRVNWIDKYIKEEVNSIKSDFKNKQYVLFSGKIEKGVDRFIDYLLLAEDNTPLAIIEAKNYSKDKEVGRIQARTYAKDIEKQTGEKIPIFLTNGHTWSFIDQHGIERDISGPFSQNDLKRRRELYRNERNPTELEISSKIVDRLRSRRIVRELSEHFSKGHRSALIVMATGTGKTRVAMGIIDLLINANKVRNALFIVDRISLANQAISDGFKRFFNEPVADLRKGFNENCTLYVSTVQTLMSGKQKKFFENFSPGFFDLIVFDEAHRSIYDKNRLVSKYFDAIKVGLTATPTPYESRNTYSEFGCEVYKPTVEYSYDEAIIDTILVPYIAEIIETKVLSLGIKGATLTPELKDQLRRQEENPELVEFTGSQFDRVFMDNKTNELIVLEFMNRCYKSDEGKPCKSIFFCASQRHAKYMKKIFGKLFPNLSNDVQVITSEMYRAEDELLRFKLNSEPRIALSVGMLDTGVDIPEVCNLVFVKPVFSSVRFWQMVGRGTRNLDSCRYKEWLPERDKKNFLIFDFKVGGHSNIKYHQFKQYEKAAIRKDVITKIFLNRVELLNKKLDEKQKDIVSNKILETINSLNEESFIVREKLPIIRKIKSSKFELKEYIKELKNDVAPLMILHQGTNPNVSAFILNTEKLFGFILDNNHDEIEKTKTYVQGMLENILQKENLSEIKAKREQIIQVMQDKFWDDLTFEDVEFLIKELASLMKYFEPDPKKLIHIDAPDLVLSTENFQKEIKEDEKLKEFLLKNPFIQKIKDDKGITPQELLKLEEELSKIRPEITIDNIQKFQKIDFLLFLRKIIGLTHEYDPKVLIEKEFDEYIIKKNHYNSKQLEFLELLKKVFANKKHIELIDFSKPPLSNENPLDKFQFEELEAIVCKCNNIKLK
jgi:type I restriction enzyme R subunit